MTTYFLQLPILIQLFILYLLAINIITFFFFGIDKIKARGGKRRVSEKKLWLLSFVGGSFGALLGMNYFRHKTKKLSFQAGFAVILIVQGVLIYFILDNII